MSTQKPSLPRRAFRVARDHGVGSLLGHARRYATASVTAPLWQYRYGVSLANGWEAAVSTERPVFADLFANLRPDDVFYDVGAHVGVFTRPVADVLTEGSVVAFEPGDGASRLRASVGDDPTVHVVEKAVSRRDGEGYHSHQGRVGLLGDTDAKSFASIDGRAILDDGDLPLPNVVKIDVFGAEVDAVEALAPLLERDECRLVYCEVHLPTSFQQKRPDDVFEAYLDEWSFTDLVETFYRCGFEVEPTYLRRDTHDVFLRAAKDGA
jgi:FkbM family methyltransferase